MNYTNIKIKPTIYDGNSTTALLKERLLKLISNTEENNYQYTLFFNIRIKERIKPPQGSFLSAYYRFTFGAYTTARGIGVHFRPISP